MNMFVILYLYVICSICSERIYKYYMCGETQEIKKYILIPYCISFFIIKIEIINIFLIYILF